LKQQHDFVGIVIRCFCDCLGS